MIFVVKAVEFDVLNHKNETNLSFDLSNRLNDRFEEDVVNSAHLPYQHCVYISESPKAN